MLRLSAVAVLLPAALATSSIVPDGNYCGVLGVAGPTSVRIPDAPDGLSLVYAQATIRHGDRITTKYSFPCWPGDSADWSCSLSYASASSRSQDAAYQKIDRLFRKPYLEGRNTFKGNCGVGQLTSLGFAQHAANGAAFRDFFVNRTGLLPPTVEPMDDVVFVRADDSPRVVQSAMSLMNGFFRPGDADCGTANVWNVHTMDELFDDMTPNPNLCPLYGKYNHDWLNSDGYRTHFEQVTAPLLKEVQQATGKPGDPLKISPVSMLDCMNTHLCHGFDVPAGWTQDLYDRIIAEATWNWKAKFSYPSVAENARAGIGFLLKELAGNINAWVDYYTKSGSPKPATKFRLYSGHDSTLFPLLNALGLWEEAGNKWTPYASFITFELYRRESSTSSDDMYVRIVYNGTPLALPGCAAVACNVTQFNSVVSGLIPGDDPVGECQVSEDSPVAEHLRDLGFVSPHHFNVDPARHLPNYFLTALDPSRAAGGKPHPRASSAATTQVRDSGRHH